MNAEFFEKKISEKDRGAVKTITDLPENISNVYAKPHKKTNYLTFEALNVADKGDVIKHYQWAVKRPDQKFLSQVPKIILNEYLPQNGPLIENGKNFTNFVVAGASAVAGETEVNVLGRSDKAEDMAKIAAIKNKLRADAYDKNLYTAIPTNNYIFPFFSDQHRSRSTSWEDDAFSSGGGLVSEGIQKVLKGFGGLLSNSYSSINYRKNFTQGTVGPVSFSFMLYNTLQDDPTSTIIKNYKLLYILQYNNMADRLSRISYAPPVVYEMEIPGIKYSPACFMQTINITNIGQVNKMTYDIFGDGGFTELHIPDAWKIDITLEDLLPESRDIYKGAFVKTGRVTVIGNSTPNDYGE